MLSTEQKKKIKSLHDAGFSVKEISKKVGIHLNTAYTHVNFLKKEESKKKEIPEPTAELPLRPEMSTAELPLRPELAEPKVIPPMPSEMAEMEMLKNRLSTIEKQIEQSNNQVPMQVRPEMERPIEQPHYAEQQQQPVSKPITPEGWLREFLTRYRVKPSCVEILAGKSRQFGLPSGEQLFSDLSNMASGIINVRDLRYLSENYSFEKFRKWDASRSIGYDNPRPELHVTPSQVVTQNPDGSLSYHVPPQNVSIQTPPNYPQQYPPPNYPQQYPPQQPGYIPSFNDQMGAFFQLVEKVNLLRNPEDTTPERTIQLIQQFLNDKELNLFREGKLGNAAVTQQTVDLEKIRSDFRLSDKKIDKDSTKYDGIFSTVADVAKDVLPAIFGAKQQPIPPLEQPQEQDEISCPWCQRTMVAPPVGVQHMSCPFCKEKLYMDENAGVVKVRTSPLSSKPLQEPIATPSSEPLQQEPKQEISPEQTPLQKSGQIRDLDRPVITSEETPFDIRSCPELKLEEKPVEEKPVEESVEVPIEPEEPAEVPIETKDKPSIKKPNKNKKKQKKEELK